MQQEQDLAKKKQLNKIKCRAIIFLVCAVVLIVISAFIPMIMEKHIVQNAIQDS